MKGKDGISFKVLDEVKTVPTDYGPKPRGLVSITNGIETYEKTWTLNQQNTNYFVEKYGKDSKSWIGKEVGIYTELIKGNESIRVKDLK